MISPSANRSLPAFLLVAAGTALGLSGTDLVLPAIPDLPRELGGGIAASQMVVAAFVAGTASGLLLFGALGSRFGRWATIGVALLAYSALSLISAFSREIEVLIGLRFLQGIAASAPAVFAPSILRALFSEAGATKALGILGSIESLVPALAPVLGARLISVWGWRSPFLAITVLSTSVAAAIAWLGKTLPPSQDRAANNSYWILLKRGAFLRYALSHACVLGGLLLFVFGAPTVIVTVMHGDISDFVWMQVVGISCFILAATRTGYLVATVGAERLIWLGTLMATSGAALIALYAACGGSRPGALVLLAIPLNVGLGLRGPPGFFRAIQAGGGDDERAASLTILAVMAVAAGSTAILAPLLHGGLIVLALACTVVEVCALVLLFVLPPLPADSKNSQLG
jgi:MFS transporter, DHA1 family, multidrug resistance protein